MQITLSAEQHCYIVTSIPDKNRVDVLRYLFQLSQALNPEYDPTQMIAVDVPESLIADVYGWLGNLLERFSASKNAALKQSLLPQLQNSPDLILQIQSITQENNSIVSNIIQSGFTFLNSLK